MAAMTCPFCRSENAATLVSLFGSQLLLSQYRCGVCGSYFEGLREDRWEDEPPATPSEGGDRDDGRRVEH